MGLLSIFKRQSDQAADAAPTLDAVGVARVRARRRLIGATVLLGLGIVGFPLLFETQPRPIPVDVPIELPRKDAPPPVSLPRPMASAPGAVVADAPAEPEPAGAESKAPAAPPPAEVAERAADQGRELPPPGAAAAASAAAAGEKTAPAALSAAPTPRAASAAASRVASAASKPAAKPASAPGEAARARALLEGGQPAASAASARVVVQVGAFTDTDKLREARHKVEKLGFKTYTQVVEGEQGKRTRVRVGPFATRAEADKAAARIKSAGLPAAILTL